MMELINENPVLLLSMPGGTEWLWIILAVILLFGGRKIPELARGIGKGMRDFKDAKDGVKTAADDDTHKDEPRSVI